MSLQIRSPANQIKTLQYTNTAAKVESKLPLVIGSHVFIPLHDAAQSEPAAYVYEAEISGVAKSAVAFTLGAKVYWDLAGNNGAGAVTNIVGSAPANTLIGYALEAMDSGATTSGLIAFNSFAA